MKKATKKEKEDIALRFIEYIPRFMNVLREEVRSHAAPNLTVPQFRVLANINRGVSRVADIAEHHGVSAPAMTKLVNSLVEKKMVHREIDLSDRRVFNLSLTHRGQNTLKRIRDLSSQTFLMALDNFSSEELSALANFLKHGAPIFEKLKARN